MKSFAKLYHDVSRREWYNNVPARLVYFHLLLSVSYSDGGGVPAGSVVSTTVALGAALGLAARTVRSALRLLARHGEITTARRGRRLLITLADATPADGAQAAQAAAKTAQAPSAVGAQYIAPAQAAVTKTNGKKAADEGIREAGAIYSAPTADAPTKAATAKKQSPIPNSQSARLIALWNDVCGEALTRVKVCSPARQRKIAARLRQFDSPERAVEAFGEVFAKVRDSAFLTGRNARHWRASFDWLIDNDTNWAKVWEGRYDDDPAATSLLALQPSQNQLPSFQHSQNQLPIPNAQFPIPNSQSPLPSVSLDPAHPALMPGYIAGAYGLPASQHEIEQAKSDRDAAQLIAELLADPFDTKGRYSTAFLYDGPATN